MEQDYREWIKWKKSELDPDLARMVRRKTRGNMIYSEDEVNRALSHDEKWASAIKGRILKVADFWLSMDDLDLVELVPVGNPRSLTPGQYHGDPVSGGNRLSLITCLETPFSWFNPRSGVTWKVGALIRNPTTGEPVTVHDDGSGFVSPNGFPSPGNRTMFVAAYRLFLIGILCGKIYAPTAGSDEIPTSSGKKYDGAIPNLSAAYAITGNPKYARKAALVMGRLAELYPWQNGTRGDGTNAKGMHWGEISTTESYLLSRFFKAWDLIFDGITPEIEKDIIRVMSKFPEPSGRKRDQPFSIKEVMHEMACYAFQACESARYTNADWKLRWVEATLTIAACTGSDLIFERVLLQGRHSLQVTVKNDFYRDGRYHYDSTSYMNVVIRQFLDMPLLYRGFIGREHLEQSMIDQVVLLNFKIDTGSILPTFGDTQEASNLPPFKKDRLAGLPMYDIRMEIAARVSPKARKAFSRYLSGTKRDFLVESRIREGDFSTLAFALPVAALNWNEKYDDSNTVLTDSSIAYLRCGNHRNSRHDLVLWGQPSASHKHGDKLGIWFSGRSHHLAASAGNYPFTWISPKKNAWETHSAACWVVLIDGMNQNESASSITLYHESPLFNVCAMVNDQAYPGSKYHRIVMLIPGMNDGDAYALDIFRLSNGFMFDYNTIGVDAVTVKPSDIITPNELELEWKEMTGSLAGKDIPLYGYEGYGWMEGIHQASIPGDFRFDFQYKQARLRVHAVSLGKERSVILARGEKGGYEMRKAPWNPHVLWRDENGDSERSCQFVAVLESMGEQPFIKNIKGIKSNGNQGENEDAFSLEIEHQDGTMDIIFVHGGYINASCPSRSISCEMGKSKARTDAFVLMSRSTGKTRRIEALGGTFLTLGSMEMKYQGSLTGKVVDVQPSTGEITISLDQKSKENARSITRDLTGKMIYFHCEKNGDYSLCRMKKVRYLKDALTCMLEYSGILRDARFKSAKETYLQEKLTIDIDGLPTVVNIHEGYRATILIPQVLQYG